MKRVQFEVRGKERGSLLVLDVGEGLLHVEVALVLASKPSNKVVCLDQLSVLKDGSVAVSCQGKDGGYFRVELHTDGSVKASCSDVEERVISIFLTLRGDCLTPLTFTQGYQSWSLSSTQQVGSEWRKKSFLAKWGCGLAGMFFDVDDPFWLRQGKGLESHNLCILETKQTRAQVLLGGTSCKSGNTSFWITATNGGNSEDGEVQIECAIDFGKDGVPMKKASEKFVVLAGTTASSLLQDFCTMFMSESTQALADPSIAKKCSPLRELGRAPLGWGSWYEFFEHVTAEDIQSVLRVVKESPALSRHLDVFQLDDGFQVSVGDWLETKPGFGKGVTLQQVGEQIREAGFVPGIWTAPFLASRTSKVFREHPDWFLRNLDNPATYLIGHINTAWRRGRPDSMIMHVFDLSNPEVLEHLENTYRSLAKHWKYFKIDFLQAGMRDGVRKNGKDCTRVEAYVAGIQAIRRGIGQESFLVGCGAPLFASAASCCFDAMRVSRDTDSEWEEPTLLGWMIPDVPHPCCSKALWGDVTRHFAHKRLWSFNDPDCLILRKQASTLSYDQVVTQTTVLALSGGLLFLTDNLTKLDRERAELGYGVLPPSSLAGEPVFDTLQPHDPPSSFCVGVVTEDSEPCVYAKVNWGKSKETIVIPRFGFDFWNQRVYHSGEEVSINPFATCALQCPSSSQALLVGSTFHLFGLCDGRIREENMSGDVLTDDSVRSQTIVGEQRKLFRMRGLVVLQVPEKNIVSVTMENGSVLDEKVDVGSDQAVGVEILASDMESNWRLHVVWRS